MPDIAHPRKCLRTAEIQQFQKVLLAQQYRRGVGL